jgi:hypothetical protein
MSNVQRKHSISLAALLCGLLSCAVAATLPVVTIKGLEIGKVTSAAAVTKLLGIDCFSDADTGGYNCFGLSTIATVKALLTATLNNRMILGSASAEFEFKDWAIVQQALVDKLGPCNSSIPNQCDWKGVGGVEVGMFRRTSNSTRGVLVITTAEDKSASAAQRAERESVKRKAAAADL